MEDHRITGPEMDDYKITGTESEETRGMGLGIETELGASAPLYKKFKGKAFHGEKTWTVSKKTQMFMNFLAYFWFGGWIISFIALVIIGVKQPLIKIPMIVLLVATPPIAVFFSVFTIAFKKNKEDPVDIHYYDVDYEKNFITGEGYDNSKEITKEEFFGKDD